MYADLLHVQAAKLQQLHAIYISVKKVNFLFVQSLLASHVVRLWCRFSSSVRYRDIDIDINIY